MMPTNMRRPAHIMLYLTVLVPASIGGQAPVTACSSTSTVFVVADSVEDEVTRDDVYKLCQRIAPKYGYDPLMILAQVEQESSYDENALRLEQGYLRRYVLPDPVLSKTSPAVQAHMASSFGLGQLLGHSLYQLGYLPQTDSLSVAGMLDHYIGNVEMQIETMCQWLKRKQGMGTSHTFDDALRRYNGSVEYPPLIYARYAKLRGVYHA